MSGATTQYGTWGDATDGVEVEESILVDGIIDEEYDTEAIVADYRQLINDRLPDGVVLAGRVFYGPYPVDHDLVLRIRDVVAEIDEDPQVGAELYERHRRA